MNPGPVSGGIDTTPDGRVRPASRCGTELDSARAKTASAMPVTGTPRSRADLTVHRPVPFWPARSTIMSTRGEPVSASTWSSTSAVISMR